MNESCHLWMSHVTQHVMSHMSRGPWEVRSACMKGSCYTFEWFMLHGWKSHITHEQGATGRAQCAYSSFMSRIWIIPVTHGYGGMQKARCAYEWFMSHIRMIYVTHMNESCRTYESVMSHMSRGPWEGRGARTCLYGLQRPPLHLHSLFRITASATGVCICVYVYIYIYVMCMCLYDPQRLLLHLHSDRKKPPLRGGLQCTMIPDTRAVRERFHDEMRRSHLVVKSLTHGSWSGDIWGGYD